MSAVVSVLGKVVGDAEFATVSRLEEHRPYLPGIIIQSEPKRMYPQGRAVAHLVGYVSEVTETDRERNRFPGAALGSISGKVSRVRPQLAGPAHL